MNGRRPYVVRLGGFTLIELLVVTAIIALLMAVLLPALSRVRKQAKAMVCQSRLRQWGMALAIYTEDNQGRFPSSLSGSAGVWLLRGAFLSGKDANEPQDSFHHFHTQDIACCPMATRPRQVSAGMVPVFSGSGQTPSGASWSVYGTTGSAFSAWEITRPAPAFRGSYGFNQWLFSGFHRTEYLLGPRLQYGINLDVLSLRGRADIPVLLDAVSPWSGARGGIGDAPWGPDGTASGMGSFVINRHREFVNGLFLDWSVQKVDLKKLWTLYWYAEFNRAGPWTKAGGVTPEKWRPWIRRLKDY